MNRSNRKELTVKMNKTFGENIKALPKEMQEILVDDLVTAYENRMTFFVQISPKTKEFVQIEEQAVEYQTCNRQ